MKLFGVFYRIRNFVPHELARTIYYACIYSKINYGIEVYGSANNNSLQKLQILQNKLMKLLTRKPRDHSTNEFHRNLNILKVQDIHPYSILSLMFNCMHGKTIPAFENYFITQDTFMAEEAMRTRNQHNIII